MCLQDKKKFSENFLFWGSGAELLHMGSIPQMSLFNCNSAQNNHQWLVWCSLEVEFLSIYRKKRLCPENFNFRALGSISLYGHFP